MPYILFKKGLDILLKRQTNIISAAVVIMATIIFSQILGLVRQRLLVAVFHASNTLGIYLASTRLPDFLFQIIFAGALASAFIPIFSEFLRKGEEKEAHKMASSLLLWGFIIFSALGILLFIFAPLVVEIFNIGEGYKASEMELMVSLTRVMLFAQLLFIGGTFFSALLQSYNHFFIPGIAAALYNLGVIIGIITLSPLLNIFAPAYGSIIGALLFIVVQIPLLKKIGFSFIPSLSLRTKGVKEVFQLMWPRTISLAIFQIGTLLTVSLISFLENPGRNYVIFDYAQTLAFAPIVLFGQSIAQAAFPMLSREKERPDIFKTIFTTSFTQMLYLILPVSVLFLVLRIPVVRLIYGVSQFDWPATVLTGKTLAYFSLSMFAQALLYLVSRAFYALHDTKTPLIVGVITTIIMLLSGYYFVTSNMFGIESLALASTVGAIANLLILMLFLDRKVNGFYKTAFLLSTTKIFLATCFMGIALYVPIKLLDQLVFDTQHTVDLILLTGISSAIGLSLYLFLTWFFNVKEATTFILIFKKLGNWKEILGKSEEVIDGTRATP